MGTESRTVANPEVAAGPTQLRSLSLRANFAWTLVGNTVYAACQWGMLVALARMASADIVGVFALALAISAPVFMFSNLQLRAVQATDAKGEFHFGTYLALRLLTTAAAAPVILGIAWFGGLPAGAAAVLLAVSAAKGTESISDVFYGLLQQHERMDRIAISMVVRGVSSLAAFCAVIFTTGSLLYGCIALSAVWAVVMMVYDVRCGATVLGLTQLTPRWNMSILGRLAALSLPLGVVMMLVSLNTNIPRYAIQRFLGEHDLGGFAAVAALLVAALTVVNALGQSTSPRLAKYHAAGNRRAFLLLYGRLMLTGLAMGLAGIAFAVLLGRWLLSAVYGEGYASYAPLLVWVAVAAAASHLQSFSGYAVTAVRCFRAQVPLLVVVTAITAGCCWWFVPRYGLIGAALALAAASTVHLAGNLFLSLRAVGRPTADTEADGLARSARPVRVLHVVGRMNRAGAETLLMHALRHANRDRFQMDFLVHSSDAGDFDGEIRGLGSRVIVCPNATGLLSYALRFSRALREHGPYDVVHSHVHHYSAYVLWLARMGGVRSRIAHSHTTGGPGASASRRAYARIARWLLNRCATAGLAASQEAACDLFGPHWNKDPRWRVFRFGIDLEQFRRRPDRMTLRRELGLPVDAFVVGHVGRFSAEKNHRLMLEIMQETRRREPSAMLLLVGDGPLRNDVRRAVEERGLAASVVFAGTRDDVPALMCGAIDVLLFPSLFEGLAVAVVEAQAAGLPCVVSQAITAEADIVANLVTRVSLDRPASEWAEHLLALRRSGAPVLPSDALSAVENSPFDINRSIQELERLYDA